jgi:hypothetical protein
MYSSKSYHTVIIGIKYLEQKCYKQNTITEHGIPMKLVTLIKMCLNFLFSKVSSNKLLYHPFFKLYH